MANDHDATLADHATPISMARISTAPNSTLP